MSDGALLLIMAICFFAGMLVLHVFTVKDD